MLKLNEGHCNKHRVVIFILISIKLTGIACSLRSEQYYGDQSEARKPGLQLYGRFLYFILPGKNALGD